MDISGSCQSEISVCAALPDRVNDLHHNYTSASWPGFHFHLGDVILDFWQLVQVRLKWKVVKKD